MINADFSHMQLDDIPAFAREALAGYIDSRRDEIDAIGAPVSAGLDHLSNFVLGGGKRIRPLFAWAGFVGGGGLDSGEEDPAAVLRAVSSLEFIQACALIHDDILDCSDTRRGKPTVHKAVTAAHRENQWLGDAEHFGESTAVLIGDLALVWAEDMLLDSGLSDGALTRVRTPWRAMRTEVIGGQLLDVTLEAIGSEDPQLSRNVNRYKTAAYTIERPLHIGSAIANAPKELTAAFRSFGRDIGIAFQLRDDLLGVFGDPQTTGKPIGDDLREGKRTELLALALHKASEDNPKAAEELRRGVGVVEKPEDVERLTEIITATGAPEEIESRIDELTASGLRYLDKDIVDQKVADTLRELAIRATERKF